MEFIAFIGLQFACNSREKLRKTSAMETSGAILKPPFASLKWHDFSMLN